MDKIRVGGWFRVGARRAKVGRVKVGRVKVGRVKVGKLKGCRLVEMEKQQRKDGRANRGIKRKTNIYRRQKPGVVISSQ